MKVKNECDFCGIGPEKADRFHDIFHLTGWPCILCTSCMDKEFGTSNKEAILGLIHDKLVERLGEEE